jgi:hypothetical protein
LKKIFPFVEPACINVIHVLMIVLALLVIVPILEFLVLFVNVRKVTLMTLFLYVNNAITNVTLVYNLQIA